MKNLHVYKKGIILETAPYYNFDTEAFTDMSHIVEYDNKIYQILCNSFGELNEPDEEAIPLEETDDRENMPDTNFFAGMDSNSGFSLSSIFSSIKDIQIEGDEF